MRTGFISTRLAGTDGVTLEVEKWARVLREMGHDVYFCAGELSGYAAEGTLIPELHFTHATNAALIKQAFGAPAEDESPETALDSEGPVADKIYTLADQLRAPLREFIRKNHLDLLIVQNALTIPMNLPLGVCLTGLIAELGIPTIAHHHDFYWERERYQTNRILDLLDTAFPADGPTIRHVTINSIAQRRLRARRKIDSIVIPNVLDFDVQPPDMDEYSSDFREVLGLREDDIFVLQPTRVIRRKGIEMALVLLNRLDLPDLHLYITHRADDEGLEYWNWLNREARMLNVDLQLIDYFVNSARSTTEDGSKVYSLWDVYPHADLVTYPSTYEGFGNGLLEAIYFKRPVVVNRYPVYNADIGPLGFQFIELDGYVTEEAVAETRALLRDKSSVQEMVERNFQIARESFSLNVLRRKLEGLLSSF